MACLCWHLAISQVPTRASVHVYQVYSAFSTHLIVCTNLDLYVCADIHASNFLCQPCMIGQVFWSPLFLEQIRVCQATVWVLLHPVIRGSRGGGWWSSGIGNGEVHPMMNGVMITVWWREECYELGVTSLVAGHSSCNLVVTGKDILTPPLDSACSCLRLY